MTPIAGKGFGSETWLLQDWIALFSVVYYTPSLANPQLNLATAGAKFTIGMPVLLTMENILVALESARKCLATFHL